MVQNVSVLSYQFSSTESHPHALVVIDELSLAWVAPSNPNAQLEDMRYEAWMGLDVTTQPEASSILLLKDIYQEGNEVRVVTILKRIKMH